MNAPRIRTRTEITRDLIIACRRLGEIGLAAELGRAAPDLAEVSRTTEGLQRLLVECRAREVTG